MPALKPDRPFLANWLRRTRRQLAPSGRLSEVALILSQREGSTPDHWSKWLRKVLETELVPTIDELTAVDTILAKPRGPKNHGEECMLLF